jgi:CBS domain-containing protein
MQRFLEYKVGDVMTYRPITIGRRTCLGDVMELFGRHDFNCLPVTEDGALLGVVTKVDVLRAFAFTPATMVPPYDAIMDVPAEEVMTRDPITVTTGTPLTAALQSMVRSGCRSLPVVVGALLVGIISREDVLRALTWAGAGDLPERGLPYLAVHGLPAEIAHAAAR